MQGLFVVQSREVRSADCRSRNLARLGDVQVPISVLVNFDQKEGHFQIKVPCGTPCCNRLLAAYDPRGML